MNILGIDLGLGTTGYGIISNVNYDMQLVDFGTIKTSPKEQLSKRLKIIFDHISELIIKYKPSIFSIEEIFYSNNVKSSLLLGHARGVAIAAAATNGIIVYEYSAKKIKQSLTPTILLIMLFILMVYNKQSSYDYPKTRKVDSVDIYHGVSIADPYRWLENDQSIETARWVKKQNRITNKVKFTRFFREGELEDIPDWLIEREIW